MTAKKKKTDIKNAQGELLQIPLADLIPTPDNPRTKAEKNDPKIRSLADSMKSKGQRVPASARPHPKKPGKYDLRTGTRRHLACRAAGIPTLLVRVRDMDDKEALEETILENADREDLTPFEYARSINALLEAEWSAADIADRYDKSERWVHRRARLTTLIPEIIEAYENPYDDIKNWPVTYLEAIVILPPETQRTFIEKEYLGDTNLKDLQERVNKYMRTLGKAKWDLTDEKLVKTAGPCATCEHRASHTPQLFDDEPDPADLKRDRCLNPTCWEKKEKAWLRIREKEFREEHPDLVKFNPEKYRTGGKTLGRCDVDKAKKNTKGAIPAFNTKTGTVSYVKMTSRAKSSMKDAAEAGKPPTLRKLRKNLSERQRMWTVWKIKKNISHGYVDADYSKLMKRGPEPIKIKEPDLKTVLAAALSNRQARKLYKFLELDVSALISALWKEVYPGLGNAIRAWREAGACYKEAERLADFFGIDIKALETASRDVFPEPPEWRDLNADGTPKKKKEKAGNKKKKPVREGKTKKAAAKKLPPFTIRKRKIKDVEVKKETSKLEADQKDQG